MTTSKPKKKRMKPIFTFLICIVLLGASVFFIYNTIKEGVTTYTLQVDISQAKKELEALQAENESLADQKEKLQDTNYVENYARGEFMITKEGEQVYHLPATENK